MRYLVLVVAMLALACTPKAYVEEINNQIPPGITDPPRPELAPGECYNKSIIPEQYEVDTLRFLKMLGSNPPDMGVAFRKIETRPAPKRWVKETDPNCRSVDPDECIVWLEEVGEPTYVEFYEVLDTSIKKLYKDYEVPVYKRISEETVEWVPVICDTKVDNAFLELLSKQLKSKGYDTPYNCQNNLSCFVKALNKFQRSEALPVGGLNFKTLDALGIEYN